MPCRSKNLLAQCQTGTKDEKEMKHIQLLGAIVMCVFGMALLATSFFVPPMGIIDPSALAAFAEILSFSGAIIGIDYKYKKKADSSSDNY